MGFFSLKAKCSICDKTIGLNRYQLTKDVWICKDCKKQALKKLGGWTQIDKLLSLSIDEIKKLIYEAQGKSLTENKIKKTEQKVNICFKDTEWTLREQEQKAKRQTYHNTQFEKFNSELDAIPKIEITPTGIKRKKNALYNMEELSFSKITKATKIEKLFPLVVLDVETTGLNKRNCDIIEFSAIKYENNLDTASSCISTLIKTNKPIPEEITKLTGITDDMISDKPFFYEIVNSIQDYIKGCNLVGHNLKFDLEFLYVNDIKLNEKRRLFDTLEIAKTVLKRAKTEYRAMYGGYTTDYKSNYDVTDYKLDTLCEYYNIYRDNAHRSLSDCLATAKLLKELIDEKI